MKMPEGDRRKYEKYLSNLASELDVMETAREEGRAEERKKTERERVRAEQEKQRAEQEKQRAEEEKRKERNLYGLSFNPKNLLLRKLQICLA